MINSQDYIYEISVRQLEGILNYFAKSPNISHVEIDDVEPTEDGHIERLYTTVNYRDGHMIPVVLDAGDEFPTIEGETK